jgi:hypothetical protein
MSLLHTNIGNGQADIVEMDTFTRIMRCQYWDTEEVRYDPPSSYINNWSYVAVAPSGSSILDPVWACVRRSYDARGKVFRDQFRKNIAWSERFNNWI